MVVANIHDGVIGLNDENQVVFVVRVELYLLDLLDLIAGLKLVSVKHRLNVIVLQPLVLGNSFRLQILVHSPLVLICRSLRLRILIESN